MFYVVYLGHIFLNLALPCAATLINLLTYKKTLSVLFLKTYLFH